MTQDFMKSWVIAPPCTPQTKEFLLKHLIYKVFHVKSGGFHMKSAGFQNYELLGDDQV